VLVTACSGSGSGSGSGLALGSGKVANSAGVSIPAGLSGALQADDVSKICASIPKADVQKLFKGPVPAVVSNPGECDWGSGGITVDIYADDADKKYYTGGAIGAGQGTALPGVGDEALWAQPVSGATVPFVTCHKGSVSVSVTPGLDVDQTTLQYTGSAPFFTVAPDSAAQYAAEEGQLCTDVFAGVS
jgi:hypothetical protein